MRYNDNFICRISIKIVRLIGNLPKSGCSTVYHGFLFIFVVSTAISAPSVQILYFVTHDIDFRLLIEAVPPICVALLGSGVTLHLIIYGKYIEQVIILMQRNCMEQRTEEERKIEEKCDKKGQILLMFFSVHAVIAVTATILFSFATPLQDLILPLNESRGKSLPFAIEFFVDEEEYYYWILLYISIAFSALIFLLVAIEVVGTISAQHVCGMFGVVGCKLGNVMSSAKNFAAKNNVNLEKCVTKNMKICVKQHRKTLEFANILFSFAEACVFLSLCCTVFIVSTSFVDITSTDRLSAVSIAIITGTFCHFFVLNYIGQDLIDSSSDIFWKAYDSNWYEYPITAQKLLLILMMRSTRYCTLHVTGFCETSIATFSAVIRVAVSYCLTLRQLQ